MKTKNVNQQFLQQAGSLNHYQQYNASGFSWCNADAITNDAKANMPAWAEVWYNNAARHQCTSAELEWVDFHCSNHEPEEAPYQHPAYRQSIVLATSVMQGTLII